MVSSRPFCPCDCGSYAITQGSCRTEGLEQERPVDGSASNRSLARTSGLPPTKFVRSLESNTVVNGFLYFRPRMSTRFPSFLRREFGKIAILLPVWL